VRRHAVALAAACAGLVGGVILLTLARSGNDPAERRAEPVSVSPPSREAEPPVRPASPPAAVPRAARRAPSAPAPSRETAAPTEAAPELGTLRIETDVPGALVFIDRRFIGTAPVTAQNIEPGTHQLTVSAEGFDGIARTIDVEPGPRDLVIHFREVRLGATLAVIHKHRMGSCSGQLVATAEGIRYDTANKDDGFSAALTDLESFQVDYQDRNLRIKVRKGREYNFTDPDGNADRLFVFHRDVDRARQRLTKGDQPASN
jgi:hypothetical protein